MYSVVQDYGVAIGCFIAALVVLSAGTSLVITCLCIHGVRALGARRSSSQHQQSTHEVATHSCQLPPRAQLSTAARIPAGSIGNLSLFCNEAYEQIQLQSTPMDFIQQDDDVYEKLPDLD